MTVRKVLPIVYMIPAGSIIEEIAQDLCDSDIAVDIGDASSPSLSPSDSRVEPNTQTTKASSLDGRDAPPDSFDASCVDGAASDLSQPLFTYIDVDNEDQGKPAHALSGETEHEHTRTNTHDPDADPLTSLGSLESNRQGVVAHPSHLRCNGSYRNSRGLKRLHYYFERTVIFQPRCVPWCR